MPALAGVLRPRLLGFIVAFVGLNILHAFGWPSEAKASFGGQLAGFAAGTAVVLLAHLRGPDWNRTAVAR